MTSPRIQPIDQSRHETSQLQRASTEKMPQISVPEELSAEYGRLKGPKDLEKLVLQLESNLGSCEGIQRAEICLRLAMAYRERHRRLDDITDQKRSASFLCQSLKAIPVGHPQNTAILSEISGTYSNILNRTKSMEDHAEAVEQLSTILEHCQENRSIKADVFQHLASICQSAFRVSGKMETLDQAISSFRSSVGLTAEFDITWLARSHLLASAERMKYNKSGDLPDLQCAVRSWEHMRDSLDKVYPADGSREGTEGKIHILWALGVAYLDTHFKSPDQPTLQRCIDSLENALAVMSNDHTRRWNTLFNLGRAYTEKYVATKDVAQLEVAARSLVDSLNQVPRSDERRLCLSQSTRVWHELYTKTGGYESLEVSMTLFEEAVQLPLTPSLRQSKLRVLADLAYDKAMRTNSPSDVMAATKWLGRLRKSLPADHASGETIVRQLIELITTETRLLGKPADAPSADAVAWLHSRTGISVRLQAEWDSRRLKAWERSLLDVQSQDNAAIEAAIVELEDLLEEPPRGDDTSQWEAMQLSRNYHCLYLRSRSTRHLDQAIKYTRQAVPDKQSNKDGSKIWLETLTRYLWEKYKASTLKEDYEAAMEAAQQSLSGNVGQFFSSKLVASDLRDRYKGTGHEAYLDQSLQLYRKTLNYLPANDQRRPEILRDIGLIFTWKYSRRDSSSDIYAATRYLEGAVQECREDDANRPRYLSQLGLIYTSRYSISGDRKDLDEAMKRLLEGVEASEDNTRTRALSLIHLAQGYECKYDEARESLILEHAIEHLERAKKIILGAGQAIRQEVQENDGCLILSHLGDAYLKLYECKGMFDMLEQSVRYFEGSMSRMPEIHPVRRPTLWELGRAYRLRWEKTGSEEHQQQTVSHLEAVLSSGDSFGFSEKVGPSRELFEVHALRKDWKAATRIASSLLSAGTAALSHSLNHSDKVRKATQFAGLVPDVAAVALLAGESPYAALKLLEAGRGLVLGPLLGLRSDIYELERDHPELAKTYTELRSRVDSIEGPVSNPAGRWLPEQQPEYRHDISTKLEQLVDDIRALPGYRWFLQVPPQEVMMSAAAHGPIVVVNASRYSCDAIIIQVDGIQALRLPGVTTEQINKETQGITNIRLLRSETLEWLWDNITDRVLNTLGYTTSPYAAWPRIWWIPTGPLAKLPLHAAGYHRGGGSKSVLDRVISSYSISITALVLGRPNGLREKVTRHPKHAVLVGMDDLDYAHEEIREVRRICQSQKMEVSLPEPCTKHVQDALRRCDIFHFAGHGSSCPQNPENSALSLNGSDQLSIRELFSMNLHKNRPFLAFLSACSTGQITHQQLVDENLHLVAAFQVAGFHHAIGTLWEVGDELCIKAARITYEGMGEQGMTHESVARGLHTASRQLRDDWVKESEEKSDSSGSDDDRSRVPGTNVLRNVGDVDEAPLLWAPYVHYGL